MAADKQSLDAIFKDVLEDGVAEGVTNKNPLKDILRTEKSPFRGREHQRLMHNSRNVSPFFSAEDGVFADAGVQGYSRVFIDQKKLMARIRMTWEVMQDSTSSEGAFVSARKSEMQYLIDDIARRDEIALNSTGKGVLAHLGSDVTAPEIDVKNPGGITNASFGNRFISAGMFLAAVNPATGQVRAGIAKVTSASSDGAHINVTGSVSGWAENDYVVQAANASVTDVLDTSFENAWEGVMSLIDDGTYKQSYFGADRTQNPAYSAYVNPATGALSTDLIQRVSDIVDQRLDGKIDMILSHHSVRRLGIQLSEADRRYNGANLLRPEPGTVAFQQGDIPFGTVNWRALRDFPLDVMMFLDTAKSGFTEYVSEPGKWVDEDGSVLQRIGSGSSGRDAFEAWYRQRKQYFVEYPSVNARLDGITGQTLAVVRPLGS